MRSTNKPYSLKMPALPTYFCGSWVFLLQALYVNQSQLKWTMFKLEYVEANVRACLCSRSRAIWVCGILTHFVCFPGAAAAAVMSSSKVTTVLRPASQLPNAATAQPAVQHIIHQPIQAGSSQTALQNTSHLLWILPGTNLWYRSCHYVFPRMRH